VGISIESPRALDQGERRAGLGWEPTRDARKAGDGEPLEGERIAPM
jgi:hypothetical protein